MGSAYLPVDRSWENYIRDADDTYEDLEKEMKCSLMKLADETCNYLHGRRFARFLTLIYFLTNYVKILIFSSLETFQILSQGFLERL